jgi:putative addiction module component (TIGR02574 family)
MHDLLAEALKLSETDRLRIADALYASCESDPRDWLDEDQLLEFSRRSAEIDAGMAGLIPAEDVFRQARERRAE